jgi:hypothetical protein
VTGIGLLTLAAAGTALYLIKVFTAAAAGTEPPIRVKGGSFLLDLVAQKDDDEWMSDSGKLIAKVGKRGGKKIAVLTLPTSSDKHCEKGQWGNNDKITITFTDLSAVSPNPPAPVTYDVTFEVSAHKDPADNNTYLKTTIDPGKLPLVPGADGRSLANLDNGYISAITMDNLTCTFAQQDHEEIVLFEK